MEEDTIPGLKMEGFEVGVGKKDEREYHGKELRGRGGK